MSFVHWCFIKCYKAISETVFKRLSGCGCECVHSSGLKTFV